MTNTGRRSRWVIVCLVVMTGIVAPVRVSLAQSSATPLPTAVVPPPEGNGVPSGAADQAGFEGGSLDLGSLGYVEEEFIVSGHANVYDYGPSGEVVVETPEVPYATRILVRRPKDARRFSGNVHVETSHPQYGINFIWPRIADYVVDNGDAYVSITTRRTTGGSSAIEGLKSFDAERYAPIELPEDGLNWDIIGQVGRLLKTRSSGNPLREYRVERLYAQGWSGGGALLLLYISDGFHDRARMPDGSPIFDGYLVGEPSGYPRINSSAPEIPVSDPRQRVQPRDVPAISLHTHPQEEFRRRPDGDRRNDRYRVYEVAGAAHSNIRLPRIYNQPDDAFANGGPLGCAEELSRFPMHHLFKSTLARLDAWASRGVTPPPSRRISLLGEGPRLDEHGNPRGGVRTTYVDVPTARYFPNEDRLGCSSFGAQDLIPPEELESLYGNQRGYVNKIVRRVDDLRREGWLLPADAREVRQEAAHYEGMVRT
jgi:Alpha/beta hydrolase domain